MAGFTWTLLLVTSACAAPCSFTGQWFYQLVPSITISIGSGIPTSDLMTYNASCTPVATCGWGTAVLQADTTSSAFLITFQYGDGSNSTANGWLLGDCAAGETIIYWGGQSQWSAPWCAAGNVNCSLGNVSSFWAGGELHLLEVSHSDIGWLGLNDDILTDAQNINTALDMMATDPTFTWQHECMLFMRAYVTMFPDREAELIERMAEGRFDMGGTFTEGFESTMLNEALARQMYTGRKWFVQRYPGLDSGVVAYHQDGPLRAVQMPQVYAKAGMRYLKHSRFGESLTRWVGKDGVAGLLDFSQLHYCEGGFQWGVNVPDILARLAIWTPQFIAAGLPPIFGVTVGCDYAPPTNLTALMQAWNATNDAMGGSLPIMRYSTFKTWMDALSDAAAPGVPVVSGERPNLWLYENSPTHHYMWSDYRDAARALPAAESWSTFRSLLEGSFAVSYPEEQLGVAWLNLTLDDHGIANEPVPKNDSLPTWLVNAASPDEWDLVYADKWSRALDAGVEIIAEAQTYIAAQVSNATAPPTATAAVTTFNSLSWPRSDVARVPAAGAAPSMVDSTGTAIPTQLATDVPGTAVFIAPGVPSFGYATTYILPGAQRAADAGPSCIPGAAWSSSFTGTFYSITPTNGGIASMQDLASGAEMFDTSGYAAGEWMELQYTGMGASETRVYPQPWVNASTFARLGNSSVPATWSCAESGPVRVSFTTRPVQTAHSLVSLRLDVYTTIKRVDLTVNLDNWDSGFGVANRVVFPIAGVTYNVTYAAPFGNVRAGLDEREAGFEDVWLLNPPATMPPFQRGYAMRPREISDWIHAGGAGAPGVMISSSVGVFDWVDVTGVYDASQPVLAPEMLVHTNSNVGPFLPEPGNHSFLFSITSTPAGGGWSDAWQAGVQPNNPLTSVIQPLSASTGSRQSGQALPPVFSFLNTTEPQAAWVTAVKKEDGADGVIVRLFAVSDVDLPAVGITLGGAPAEPLKGAARTNLIELDPQVIPGAAGNATVYIPVGHWAIETLRLDVMA